MAKAKRQTLDELIKDADGLYKVVSRLLTPGLPVKVFGRIVKMPKILTSIDKIDIMHDIIVYILSHKDAYNPEFAPSTWISAICLSIVLRRNNSNSLQVKIPQNKRIAESRVKEFSLDNNIGNTQLADNRQSVHKYCDAGDKAILNRAIQRLSTKERQAIRAWLHPSPTKLRELAAKLGLSRQRVDQIQKGAVEKLRMRYATKYEAKSEWRKSE